MRPRGVDGPMVAMASLVGAVVLSSGLLMVAAGCGNGGSSTELPARGDGSAFAVPTGSMPGSTAVIASDASIVGDSSRTGVVIAGGEVRINGSVVGSPDAAGTVPIGTVTGSGIIVTEDRALSGFHALELHGFGTVDIVRGDREGVQVEADDNVVSLVHTEVVAGRLIIGLVTGTSLRNATLRVHVQATALDELATEGSVDATATGLIGTRFALTVRGSGDIELAGTSDELSVVVDGTGDVDAGGLMAQRATVRVEGSGDVRVQATSTLDVTIDGTGDITYLGTPALSTNISGSGDLSAE